MRLAKAQLHIIILGFILIYGSDISTYAQIPIFNMPSQVDTTVIDCKGEFIDSDAGTSGNYLAEAKDTFRICTGGIITMWFTQFQLENGLDTLFFYNGNTISPGALIGAFTGSDTPSGISADGCLTIVFKSSFVLQDAGWMAEWTSTVVPPVPPDITISPVPSCNTTTVDVQMSKNIPCAAAFASAFQLTGVVNPIVTNATAINCIGDSTQTVRLDLSIPLNQNCDYNVDFTIDIPDNCDSLWTFTVSNSFTIIDCAIIVNIIPSPNDTVCVGNCAQIEAVLNSCLAYDYTWSHGLPNQTTHNVCPTATTTYTLGVQSTSGGPTYTNSITITVEDPQITAPANNPLCQSDTPFNLVANPPGGTWSGTGITDDVLGTFDPDTSGQGTHTITYDLNGLCSATIDLDVLPMDAGLDEAACPGAPPFSLSGFTPTGGTWSGYSGLTTAGIFDPTTIGTYTVTYSHSNGCTDTKQVFVDVLSINNSTDTLCQSAPNYTLTVSPPGGRWKETAGVVDTLNGIIDPSQIGMGHQEFYYVVNGCTDTAHVFNKEINAGYNLVFCPSESPYTITQATPTGGNWISGGTHNGGVTGLQNGTGLFDPGAQSGNYFRDTLIYTAGNGCFDSIVVHNITTYVNYDSLFFCSNDNQIILNWSTTRRGPGGGVWTGVGVSNTGNNYYFNPSIAGYGSYTLTYTANTCSDTIVMIVYPEKLSYNDTTICTTQAPFLLDSIGLTANWQGQGIVNNATGLFDPTASGLGTFPIIYSTQSGCSDTINVTIYLFEAANIAGLQTKYCYTTATFPFNLTPSGGTLTGTGIVGNTFSPSAAGTGLHRLHYSFGVGPCYTEDSIIIDVTLAITTTVSSINNPICIGEASTINIASLGGDPAVPSHTHSWSHNLFATNSQQVNPNSTTTYTITTSDGCSDDVVDTLSVMVHPQYSLNFITSEIACNGNKGTAEVLVTGLNTYSYLWNTNPPELTNSIKGTAGSKYSVQVTDDNTSCTYDSTVTIPGYGIISSLFSVDPNLPCIPYQQNLLTFIDLSLGATQGYWELSNGITIPYVIGERVEYLFEVPGEYSITQYVENEGGCVSETYIDFCIAPPIGVFIPDIFSPNGDEVNDVFYVRSHSIKEMEFIIYDRWGTAVFESSDLEIGWDGTINGGDAETGVYVWRLNATMLDDTKASEKGDLTLVR